MLDTDGARADLDVGRQTVPVFEISDTDAVDIVAFLESLTDDCAADPQCTARWIRPRDGGPDSEQVNAVDV